MTRIAIDEDAIRRLALLLDETGLAEIEIAEGESRLRVARATVSANAISTCTD